MTTNGREVKCWFPNYLRSSPCHEEDPEDWYMGTTSAERKPKRKAKMVCEVLVSRQERKTLLHRLVTKQGNGYIVTTPNAGNHGLTQDKHQYRLAVLTKLGPFWLILVFVDVSRTLHETLQQLWRRRKMAWCWVTFKDLRLIWKGIYKYLERWEKCVTKYGAYME